MGTAMTWADAFLRTLKENDVRLVTYVPDNVLTPLIGGAAADNYFMSVGATREDEAVGTLAGAYMGGPARRGDDADQRLRAHCERAGFADRALPDPGDHRRVRARDVGRVQHRPGHRQPDHAADARCHRGRASHLERRSHHAVHCRQVDQAGIHHAKPGGFHPVAAAHRRQSAGRSQIEARDRQSRARSNRPTLRRCSTAPS